MKAWDARIALARLGFRTFSRLEASISGTHIFSLWAATWHWNGIIAEVNINDHTAVDPGDPAVAALRMRLVHETVHEACLRGLREFPDSIPGIAADGRLDDGRLRLIERHWPRIETDPGRRSWPSEDIPAGVEVSRKPGDPVIDACLHLATLGLRVEDSLDPFFGRQRLIRDCQDRTWGYRARPAMPRLNGRLIRGAPVEITSSLIDPDSAAQTLRVSGEMLCARFEASTDCLPPGFSYLGAEKAEAGTCLTQTPGKPRPSGRGRC